MANSPYRGLALLIGLLIGAQAHAAPMLAYDNVVPVQAPQAMRHQLAPKQMSGTASAQPMPAKHLVSEPADNGRKIIPDGYGIPQSAIAAAESANAAQGTPVVGYGDLSHLEEPLAYKLGKATLTISGAVVVAGRHDFNRDYIVDRHDAEIGGVGQIELQQRLANRWTVGFIYNGQITNTSHLYYSVCGLYCNTYAVGNRYYNNDFTAYVRTSWGTVMLGNVGNVDRNDTRRRPGYGETVLAGDDFLGQMSRWGGAYQVRLGPTVSTVVVDQDGNFEVGDSYQRPLGTHDIRFTTRFRDSQVHLADGLGNLRSLAGGGVADLTYGSSIYDIGAGFEHMTGRGLDMNRWFVSSGARTKMGLLAMSAEGHYGQIDGSPEKAASLGVSYAFARGLSTNLGLNYSDANVVRNGITIFKPNTETATASVRYAF